MKRAIVVAAVVLLVAGIVLVATRGDAPIADAPTAGGGGVSWIVAGGGSTPESNEVSIEDDLRLARSLFSGDGLTLFASGRDNRAVRVASDAPPPDALVAELGAIFNPRPGRQSTYRETGIAADGAATPTNLLDAIRDATSRPGRPLTVYVAGHGDKGETPADNALLMWANHTVTPVDLADALGSARRTTRLVFTTCYSGGFAEIAFEGADAERPAASSDVCGLFASTWDLEAGGCDPDPNRGAHDGYGVHFLNALDGKTRSGEPTSADLGAAGVSLLDAHTWARMKSGSIDVPTTTSERWLRAVVSADATAEPLALPHEQAVIEALGPRFDNPSEAAARERLNQLNAEIVALREQEAVASQAETDAYWDVAAALLARWPVLDDPWHAKWRRTLDDNREAIQSFLQTSPLVQTLAAKSAIVDRIANERASLEVRRAPLMRLQRAHETQRLAGALAARGGADWHRFERFRTCEDSR